MTQTPPGVSLTQTDQGLSLIVTQGPLQGGNPIRVDLTAVDGSSPVGRSLRQPIAKAVGLFRRDHNQPPLTLIDATAGFGQDAWLLAQLGCHVTAIERSDTIAALLRDGLQRALTAMAHMADHITLTQGDARTIIPQLPQHDVIYLDPMFPAKRKATERKSMRVLRQIVGHNHDAAKLFDIAIQYARRRVVVKRPLHAPPLTDRCPTVTHKGKSLRYDIYAAATP